MSSAKHSDSKSLWNCTVSPGWTKEEVIILKRALMYFGIGRWKKITDSQALPGKSINQIYMQTQRILGQQSLGDFVGLKVDVDRVFFDNMKKEGVVRKNNCIINTGDNPTKEERQRNIRKNQAKYGLTREQLQRLKRPKRRVLGVTHFMTTEEIEKRGDKFTTIETIEHLLNLRRELERRIRSCDSKSSQFYLNSQESAGTHSISNKENISTALNAKRKHSAGDDEKGAQRDAKDDAVKRVKVGEGGEAIKKCDTKAPAKRKARDDYVQDDAESNGTEAQSESEEEEAEDTQESNEDTENGHKKKKGHKDDDEDDEDEQEQEEEDAIPYAESSDAQSSDSSDEGEEQEQEEDDANPQPKVDEEVYESEASKECEF